MTASMKSTSWGVSPVSSGTEIVEVREVSARSSLMAGGNVVDFSGGDARAGKKRDMVL